MKLVQTEKILSTNAQFTSQEFGIGNTSKIIRILRDKLYKHKVRTLVQEYICNARDAMRESKSKGTIEITLPTTFQPTFKVRDFGPGISPDRMSNVFLKYGNSTKDESNDETGGFGIGAKSAWAYTESFTIITFIGGIQRTYIAHIGSNNNGRLDFLGEGHTDAPNGTEIQIAVSPSDISEFKNAAFRAVYFWSKDERPFFRNVVQGDLIEHIQGEVIGNMEICTKLHNNIAPVSYSFANAVASIDGIAYQIDASLVSKCPSLKKLMESVVGILVLHIKNGQVEVSASREEISDSSFTLENLEKISQVMLADLNKKLTKEFSKVKTPFEHLSVFMKLKDSYNLDNYSKYGDFTVNDNNAIESNLFSGVKMEYCQIPAPKFNLSKENLNKSGRRYYSRRHAQVKPEWFNQLYYIDGTETMLTTNYRIRAALQNSGHGVVVFTKLPNDAGQFDKLKKGLGFKDLKTVSFVKPQRQPREIIKIERTKQEFVLWDMSKWRNQTINVSLESNNKKWLYVERTDNMDKTQYRDLSEYLEKYGVRICALSKSNIQRVKGDKNFKPLADYLKTYKVSNIDIAALKTEIAINKGMMVNLIKLTGLTDRFIVDMINEYKSHDINKGFVPKMLKDIIGKVDEVEQFKIVDKALAQELNQRYPLLSDINWYNNKILSEIVCYMNSK